MPKPRSVTVTNDIKVLRSGSPWLPAIIYGIMFAPVLWLIVSNLFPIILWVVLFWCVQSAFNQFNWFGGYEYDLKRTDPRKTVISNVFLILLLVVILFFLFGLEEPPLILTILASIGVGCSYMLLTKYFSPWVYKEPRSEHFPAMEAEL